MIAKKCSRTTNNPTNKIMLYSVEWWFGLSLSFSFYFSLSLCLIFVLQIFLSFLYWLCYLLLLLSWSAWWCFSGAFIRRGLFLAYTKFMAVAWISHSQADSLGNGSLNSCNNIEFYWYNCAYTHISLRICPHKIRLGYGCVCCALFMSWLMCGRPRKKKCPRATICAFVCIPICK